MQCEYFKKGESMKLLKTLAIIGFLSTVGMISAMNIETGKEFPSNNLENMPRILGCDDYVLQACQNLQKLHEYIKEKKEAASRMKFASKDDFDIYNKTIEAHIKNNLREVKILIDKAEKEAGSAV